jgi:hypothetical protein
LTLIVFTRVAAEPRVSVAVIVAVYVSEATELETLSRAKPDVDVDVSSVIPELEGDTDVSTKVFAPVPFVAVIVSRRDRPTVVKRAVVVSPVRVVAGLTTTVITDTTLAPTASVAVMVSMYVDATTPVAATLRTAIPEAALEVSNVIPDCVTELCSVKVLVPVPLETVTVSLAVRPTVVVIVELVVVWVGGELILMVTIKLAVFAPSVAVKVS